MKQVYVLILALCASVAWATDDALSGKFTVSAEGKQVQFAPGNLQKLSDTWQFAASQTEIVGVSTAYASEHQEYTGAIDLFTWDETNAYATTNAGWRMLTNEEWEYILREEEIGYGPENAGQATIVDSIATRHGLVILPDDWTTPTGLQDFEVCPNDWTTNRYNDSIWNLMETAGAVFLPCVGETGSYWSATAKDENIAYGIYFYESAIQAGSSAAGSSQLGNQPLGASLCMGAGQQHEFCFQVRRYDHTQHQQLALAGAPEYRCSLWSRQETCA